MPQSRDSDAKAQLPVNPAWEVHPSQVNQWLKDGEDVLLVDVRQLREWNYAKIAGALFTPLRELEEQLPATLDGMRQRRLVTYCHAGVRSLRAAALLRQYGFQSVHSMAGGIEAWSVLVDPSVPRY